MQKTYEIWFCFSTDVRAIESVKAHSEIEALAIAVNKREEYNNWCNAMGFHIEIHGR